MKLGKYYLAVVLAAGIMAVTPSTVKADTVTEAVEAAVENAADAAEAFAGTETEELSENQAEDLEAEADSQTEEDQTDDTEVQEDTAEAEEDSARQSMVEFALQFVGGKYVYGGLDPNKGVDCSGFTRYIMKYTAGITLSHSSRAQAGEGKEVDSSQMRPGDLIFYGSKKAINHVAMYIGDGQVVHASSEKNGIRTSKWTYRTPVKIVNVLGD